MSPCPVDMSLSVKTLFLVCRIDYHRIRPWRKKNIVEPKVDFPFWTEKGITVMK